jgi:hypothetical protein
MNKSIVILSFLSSFSLAASPYTKVPFQEISLESRCAGLGDYVGEFVVNSLKGLAVTEISCSEGAGIGGITYAWEFATGTGTRQKRWQLDVAIPEVSPVVVRLCDLNGSPVECSPPGKVEFGNGGRFKTRAEAEAATRDFLSLHGNMGQLVPHVSKWVAQTPKEVTFFGKALPQFATELASKNTVLELPLDKGRKLGLKLTKDADSTSGSVVVAGAGFSDIAACLGCKKANCSGDGLRWRLDARLFSVMRRQDMQTDGTRGVHWFVDGNRDKPLDVSRWRFSCGVSRWSIQHLNVESKTVQKK